MKILLATEKPFSAAAVGGIKDIVTGAGHELALLEKYTDKSQLLAAVSDAEAIIIRSDKITAEVIAAAPKLKIVQPRYRFRDSRQEDGVPRFR